MKNRLRFAALAAVLMMSFWAPNLYAQVEEKVDAPAQCAATTMPNLGDPLQDAIPTATQYALCRSVNGSSCTASDTFKPCTWNREEGSHVLCTCSGTPRTWHCPEW